LKSGDEYHENSEKYLFPYYYLIDVNIDNCKSSCGMGILFTQPHNKSSLYNPRCDSWDSVIEFMKKELK